MGKIFNLVIVLLTVSFLFYACSGSDSVKYKLQAGKYSFIMSDSTGKNLIEGDMTLIKIDTMKVSGSYEVTKKFIDKIPGMSMTKGIYEGTYDTASAFVSLNMNPKMADANVFVKAKIYRNSLVGEWNYSTLLGSKLRGNFVAEKIE
jgi:hypothetical protein